MSTDEGGFQKLGGGGRHLRAVVHRRGVLFTLHPPTPISCTIGTDGRSPTNKEDHSTANAPRNPATMGGSKEAPFRGARSSAVATVWAPRNGNFGYGEFHIGPFNAAKSPSAYSRPPIIGITLIAQLNGKNGIRPTSEEMLAKTNFR